MTTANGNETAGDGQALTAEEMNNLILVSNGGHIAGYNAQEALYQKGLIGYNKPQYLTDLGKQVLAASQPPTSEQEAAPTKAERPGERPSEVFWREFKNQDNPIYQSWVHNQCIVRFNERKIEHIFSEASVKLEDWAYEQEMLDKYLLHVKWLKTDTQPAEAGEAGGMQEIEGLTMGIRSGGSRTFYRNHNGYHEVFYDTLDNVTPLQAENTALKEQNERLQADLATLQAQVGKLREALEAISVLASKRLMSSKEPASKDMFKIAEMTWNALAASGSKPVGEGNEEGNVCNF